MQRYWEFSYLKQLGAAMAQALKHMSLRSTDGVEMIFGIPLVEE